LRRRAGGAVSHFSLFGILAQALRGDTSVEPVAPAVSTTQFQSAYVLVS
jgi:hypothetical protein